LEPQHIHKAEILILVIFWHLNMCDQGSAFHISVPYKL